MLQRSKPLVHAVLLLLISSSAPSHGGSSVAAPESTSTPVVPASWNRPVAFTLEARTVEDDAAFGMHVVRPVFHSGPSTVLVEGYGFEGEEELGLVGGGAIYRQAIGVRSALEASVFFEGLRSTDGYSYPQIGAGLSFSPDRWVTLRANGYLPLQSKETWREGVDHWSEIHGHGSNQREVDYRRETRGERAPMRGFDVEAELRLPEPPRWVDPRLAVGYAYREAEDLPQVYAGVTVRGELHLAKHWVAEAEWRNDAHEINQEWRVGLRYEMLLGAPRTGDAGRGSEAYLPVERFPWPTMARSVERGQKERRETRALAPTAVSQPLPDDCCPAGNPPLIFD